MIVTTYSDDDASEEDWANARLIAAAPDLLAALETVAEMRAMTLLGPDSKHRMGDDAPCLHEMGANAAFERAAEVAQLAIDKAKESS